jgi:hypothetical protein
VNSSNEKRMNIILLAVLFCLLELAISAIFYGPFVFLRTFLEEGYIRYGDLGFGVLTALARVLMWQTLLQIIFVVLTIRFNGWSRLWPILLAVLFSMIIFSLIAWGLKPTAKYNPFEVTFMFGGIPILLGSISAWLILYKWIGLKP